MGDYWKISQATVVLIVRNIEFVQCKLRCYYTILRCMMHNDEKIDNDFSRQTVDKFRFNT